MSPKIKKKKGWKFKTDMSKFLSLWCFFFHFFMISKAILEDCFGDFGRLNCYF